MRTKTCTELTTKRQESAELLLINRHTQGNEKNGSPLHEFLRRTREEERAKKQEARERETERESLLQVSVGPSLSDLFRRPRFPLTSASLPSS